MPDETPTSKEPTRIDTVIATLDQLQAELDRVVMIQAILIGAFLALALECSYLLWREHASS
jgi:hypothetical protein